MSLQREHFLSYIYLRSRFQKVDVLDLSYKFSYNSQDYTVPVTVLVGYDLLQNRVERCDMRSFPDFRRMKLNVQNAATEIDALMHSFLVLAVIEHFGNEGRDPQIIRQYLDQYR